MATIARPSRPVPVNITLQRSAAQHQPQFGLADKPGQRQAPPVHSASMNQAKAAGAPDRQPNPKRISEAMPGAVDGLPNRLARGRTAPYADEYIAQQGHCPAPATVSAGGPRQGGAIRPIQTDSVEL